MLPYCLQILKLKLGYCKIGLNIENMKILVDGIA